MRILQNNTIASDPGSSVRPRRNMLARPVGPVRRGSMLVEVIVGCVLLGVFFLAAVPMMSWVRTSRLATDDQQIAVAELSNLMERIAALPASDRTDDRLRHLTLSESVQTQLDDAQLTVGTASLQQFSDLRKVTLSLTWTNHAGQRVRPIELAAWFAAANEEASN